MESTARAAIPAPIPANDDLRPVAPTRPIAAYLGGKKNLAKTLCARIEATPHKLYAEVFVGGGGVFLRRHSRPKCEVINDYGRDVSNLYRILQRHHVAFLEMWKWQLTSRAEFERLIAVDPETLTDLERAARFVYLQRCCFGGKLTGRNFGVSARDHRAGRIDVTRLAGELTDLHERLAGVIVERLPWQEMVVRYDTPETLFYLDPPYFGCEDDYGPGLFDQGQFAEIAQVLAGVKGRFILSLNDRPEVREIFAAFRIEAVGTHYGLAGAGSKPAREVIISR